MSRHDAEIASARMTRRRFLVSASAGAGAVALGGGFFATDFLRFAGLDPAARHAANPDMA
jgi:hypothetical protein